MGSVVEKDDGTFVVSAYGKSVSTKYYKRLPDDVYNSLLSRYISKPTDEEVAADFNSIASGKSKYGAIKRKYTFDLRCGVLVFPCKWTVDEVFKDIDLLSIFYGKALSLPKLRYDNGDLYLDIMALIRLKGSAITSLPSQFPINEADSIVRKYNVNNNWFDYSCGWGDRLLCALRNGINYFGTDPNYILTERLQQMTDEYARYTLRKKSEVQINTTGSEVFIDKYFNSMGLAFSSPPYFCFEDYKIGSQSYCDGVSYEDWLSGYMVETMKNIHDYLIADGYFILNIKSFNKFDLESDCVRLAEDIGFALVDTETLTNMCTRLENGEKTKTNENMFVFKKRDSSISFHDVSSETETVAGLGRKMWIAKTTRFF